MNKLKDTYLYAFEETVIEYTVYIQGEVRKMVHHLLMIGRKGSTTLNDAEINMKFKNLSNIRKLEIGFGKSGAESFTKLLDNKELLDKLADYLRNKEDYDTKYAHLGGSIDKKMNCTAFCFFMRGWGEEDDMITMWDDGIYKVGDVITIYNKNKEEIEGSVHTSMYVGEGLFLSKFGPGSDLILTSLENMKNFYDTDVIIKEMPRYEYEERFGKQKEA